MLSAWLGRRMQFIQLKRREFISVLAGAAAWPVAARGQQSGMAVIGFLNGQSPGPFAPLLDGFHRALNEAGFVEGRNVAIEYRWGEGRADRVPALAAELVQRKVDVIVATGGAHNAVKAATSSIPIVCTIGGDPVKSGLVASINRPGGNLTGASVLSSEMEGKRLELLRELVPTATLIGLLVDPSFEATADQISLIEAAAGEKGWHIRIFPVTSDSEIQAAFSSLNELRAGAVVIAANPFLNSRRRLVVGHAAHYAMPDIYEFREAAEAGGLISYDPSIPDIYRQVGVYTAK